MIAERSQTAQLLIGKLSASGVKVPFIPQDNVARALTHLEEKGIPTAKDEDYKYCNIDGVLRREFKKLDGKLQDVSDVSQYRLPGASLVVMVNGAYAPELSDKATEGIEVSSLDKMSDAARKLIGAAAPADSDALVALNTAFSGAGLCLNVQAGKRIEKPVHILSVLSASGETAINPRTLVIVGNGSGLVMIEQQVSVSTGKIFSSYLSEKFVGENANLYSHTIQDEGPGGYSVTSNHARVAASGNYSNVTVTLSGQLVRNNHHVSLDGQGSEAHLYGLFRTGGTQLVDNHTVMDHRVPNCESNELYKGVADDRSTGVFNGKIFVRRDAQKTNAYQSSKNILLSDDATINAKPQLEIYANDVKCSHGTSTGRIDENAVFYLKSRGIGAESARRMLLASFAGEVIDKVEVESLRTKLATFFENGFGG